MAEEQNPPQLNPATRAEAESAPPRKARKTRARKTEPRPSQSTEAILATSTKGRRYSESEKAEKLRQIEAQIADGTTLKAAVKNASISEQTYYQWKRAAPMAKRSQANVAAGIETLADLVKLEAENQRLRGLLAEKLHAENTELRQRLGLD
ncbi:transposase [Mycoplana dimorpha]|uniref:Putative transposase n=1 Tax=Mycoplana dimorpha TaxID=28320 RepID=A0A2T5AR27_MYCDI|nr:transposase [Mycoplana dimorpha]PTM89159.1 putative transposase [Mycoplana dimorpha]